jgi:hypothetical protein
MALSSEILTDEEAIISLTALWGEFEAPPPTCTLFLSPGYQRVWRELFAEGARPGLAVARERSELVGLMPLMFSTAWRKPTMHARFDSHPRDVRHLGRPGRWRILPVRQATPCLRLESFDLRGGFLTIPGADRFRVLRSLLEALSHRPRWDVGIFPVADSEVRLWVQAASDSGLRILVRSLSRRFYWLEGVPDWQGLMARASHNFRKSSKRGERRVAEAGLEVRRFDGPELLTEGLVRLEDVAARSWKANPGNAEVSVPWSRRQSHLYRRLAEEPGAGIELVIVALIDGDATKAAASSLRRRDLMVGGVTFFDPEISHLSPGRSLMRAFFEWGMAHGVSRYDFNATDPWCEPYANRTATYCQVLLFTSRLYSAVLARLARGMDPGAPDKTTAAWPAGLPEHVG